MSVYDKGRNGSAWTWDSLREQWYYHKFHQSQPDLNLRNEEVIEKLMVIYTSIFNKIILPVSNELRAKNYYYG